MAAANAWSLLRRIRAGAIVMVAIALASPHATILATPGTPAANSTAINPQSLLPQVATYRNGYGTHFRCDSACYFSMYAYLAMVAIMLAILFLIPVQSPSTEESTPFVLWFGNDHKSRSHRVYARDEQQYTFWDRLSMLIHGFPELEPPQQEVIDESFHEEVDVIPEYIDTPKTFESVGVETDETLLPAFDAGVHGEPVAASELSVTIPPEKKPGIFAPLSIRMSEDEFKSIDHDGTSPSRRELHSPRRHSSVIETERRSSIAADASAGAARENLLVQVERRTSMQKRAEKRKEYAKSDLVHDNLHEHELHMYEYLEFVRSLLEGIVLKKITQKSAKVVKRTFFITPTLNTVYWNQVGNKTWINKKSSFETYEIDRVVKGLDGNGSKVKGEKQNLCLSVVIKDGKRLDLEAKDEASCQRLFLGFTQLAKEKLEEKRRRDAGEVDQNERDESGEQRRQPDVQIADDARTLGKDQKSESRSLENE